MGLGEIRLGEMGLGKMGQNPFGYNYDTVHYIRRGRLRVFVEGGTCAMAQSPVLACFEICCASRGGPCDSEALVQGGPKKSKPDNCCNNFVYCQPIFIIFGTYTL